MSRGGQDTVTVARFEPCQECTDGSCRACGTASSEDASPGVRLVVRRVRFVRCAECNGKGKTGLTGVMSCTHCGPTVHRMASPGVTVETAAEHDAYRWVASVHFNRDGKPRCGTSPQAAEAQLTDNKTEVTCARCKKWMK